MNTPTTLPMTVEELIRGLERSARLVGEIATLGDEALARSYAPGKWDAYTILAHVADTELVFFYRFLHAVAEEGTTITPFDSDRWAAELARVRRPAEISAAQIAAIHSAWVHQLRTQPESALRHKTFHPERGEMTPLSLAEYNARHVSHHVEQLEAIRDGKEWRARS